LQIAPALLSGQECGYPLRLGLRVDLEDDGIEGYAQWTRPSLGDCAVRMLSKMTTAIRARQEGHIFQTRGHPNKPRSAAEARRRRTLKSRLNGSGKKETNGERRVPQLHRMDEISASVPRGDQLVQSPSKYRSQHERENHERGGSYPHLRRILPKHQRSDDAREDGGRQEDYYAPQKYPPGFGWICHPNQREPCIAEQLNELEARHTESEHESRRHRQHRR
jgi:hypothetical protein